MDVSNPKSDGATYKFTIELPQGIIFPAELNSLRMDREEFFQWIWDQFTDSGLVGVHEGTLLCEDAVEAGLETESWTVDSGEAPRERDWVGHVQQGKAELFFATEADALDARTILMCIPEVKTGPVVKQEQEDWDAQWKASFLNSGTGVPVPPFWQIMPPWAESKDSAIDSSRKVLKINPGAGFGTGTHETTQLCLEAIGDLSQPSSFSGKQALDFGSGSGILAIGLALLGAHVDAVEIDSLAIENAQENASLNEVQNQIVMTNGLHPIEKRYSVIVANILRPILIEFAESLVNRLEPQGALILSGLIEKDVEPVVTTYQSLLGPEYHSQVHSLGEWRSIVFRK
jgi:ribosomal protein L11 methyltransferase